MLCVENSGRGRLNLVADVGLMPGVAEVDEKATEKSKKHRTTKHYLSTRQVKVVSGPQVEAPTPAVAVSDTPPEGDQPVEESQKVVSLLGMSAKEAIAFVKKCEDSDLLLSMADEETRSTVDKAINDRLNDLLEEG